MGKKKKTEVQSLVIKKGKTKEQVEKETKEIFGMSMDEIALQLPYELKIGDEEFEIERKSVRESFKIVKRLSKTIKNIYDNTDKEKLINDFKETDMSNIKLSKVGDILINNMETMVDAIEDLYIIFSELYVKEEDRERFDSVSFDEFNAALPNIMRIIYPLLQSPIQMLMKKLQATS